MYNDKYKDKDKDNVKRLKINKLLLLFNNLWNYYIM